MKDDETKDNSNLLLESLRGSLRESLLIDLLLLLPAHHLQELVELNGVVQLVILFSSERGMAWVFRGMSQGP